jgi:glucans biosynthesis protein
VSASLDDPPRKPLLAAKSTRIDPPHDNNPPRFLIDFIGRSPVSLNADSPVAAQVTASHGQIQNLVVQPNDVTGGWRVFFDLVGSGGDQVELRAELHLGKQPLSETWDYLWIP